MTRAQLLASISSMELTGWQALFEVQAEEVEHRRDLADAGEGGVVISGRLDDDDDDETEDPPDGD